MHDQLLQTIPMHCTNSCAQVMHNQKSLLGGKEVGGAAGDGCGQGQRTAQVDVGVSRSKGGGYECHLTSTARLQCT